jgi:hypothetical protein
LRGLPYSVTLEDIQSFFSKFRVVPNSIKIGLHRDGLKTGEGAILFETEE